MVAVAVVGEDSADDDAAERGDAHSAAYKEADSAVAEGELIGSIFEGTKKKVALA